MTVAAAPTDRLVRILHHYPYGCSGRGRTRDLAVGAQLRYHYTKLALVYDELWWKNIE